MTPLKNRAARPARRRVRRFVCTVGAFALLAGALPVLTGAGLDAADAAPVTVTGTVSGDHAWDPDTNSQYTATPSVTVDQSDDLTDQVVHVTWNNFTPSVNSAGSFFSTGTTNYAVTVLECKGTDPVDPTQWSWPDFGSDCYNHTPDDASAENGVGNEAYSLTGPDGSGEADLHVETSVENDFLGCSSTQPCSIVVVPNWGGKQPSGEPLGNKQVNCAFHRDDTSFINGQYAVDTDLGNACSWSDRIVVPLSFAPTPASCPAKDYAFAAEGAPMLARTMQQWQAGWCTGSNSVNFNFDSGTNEYLARQSFLSSGTDLGASTDVALVNRPAAATAAVQKRFTYAPVANSAITIAFHIDNQQTGALITDITLDARLVAKLITQSYSLDFGCTEGGDVSKQGPTCDPAVKGNPVDIFDDPEFQALNPQYTRTDFPAQSLLNRGQFLPLALSGDSDMTYELTRWIESDPSARAFINGTPDRWGMHVNTYYKDETLPLDQFQVLDPGYTAPESAGVPGQSTMQVAWNPISGLANVSASLVTDRPSAINPTLPACGNGVPCVYGRFGSQLPGTRALFAITDLADAAADRFPSAKLVNSDGKPVAPDSSGLAAGVSDMSTNADTITQSEDFADKDPAQYPLTTVNYAMVPRCGVTAAKATAIKTFLAKVTTSQTISLQPGTLAPGNLALTKAQTAQTKAAAGAVTTAACPKSSEGNGSTPGSGPGKSGKSGTPGHGKHSGTSGPNGGGHGSAGDAGGSSSGLDGASGTTDGTGKASTSTTPPGKSDAGPEGAAPNKTALAAYGIKRGVGGGGTGFVLPLVLLVSLALLLGGPGTLWLVSTGKGPALAARGRKLLARKGATR